MPDHDGGHISDLQTQIDRWQREADRTPHQEEKRALQVAIDHLKKQIEKAKRDAPG